MCIHHLSDSQYEKSFNTYLVLLCGVSRQDVGDHGRHKQPILCSSVSTYYSSICTSSLSRLFAVSLCADCLQYDLRVLDSRKLVSSFCVREIWTVSFWFPSISVLLALFTLSGLLSSSLLSHVRRCGHCTLQPLSGDICWNFEAEPFI